MSTATAPTEIAHVTLTVHDLPGVAAFYEQALGLRRLSGDATEVTLGADRPFLTLQSDRAARRSAPSEAGLFHTAFLLPDRTSLARWLSHVAATGVQLQGASDHLVSEAIYLADPEGNGIEVYVDRPRSAWAFDGARVRMDTLRLDLNALLRTASGPWTGAPDGTVIGHVHLQVGDVGQARDFWTGAMGMDEMAGMPSATFLASGGYHHHIAGNIWNSRGAKLRSQPATGLARVDLASSVLPPGDRADPWGTAIRVIAK
jgi:catechol 2,3-dioxygenase